MVKRAKISGPDFDRELLMRKGAEKYRADKRKAGTIGGSMVKGSTRPWARKNMLIAALYRKNNVGKKFTVTALESFYKFEAGKMYTMTVQGGPGIVVVEGLPMPIKDVVEKFKIHKNA